MESQYKERRGDVFSFCWFSAAALEEDRSHDTWLSENPEVLCMIDLRDRLEEETAPNRCYRMMRCMHLLCCVYYGAYVCVKYKGVTAQ